MKAVSVGTTPVLLVAAGNREFLHIYNNGGAPVYVCYDGACDSSGGVNTTTAALTTANGLPIPPGGILLLDNDAIRNISNHDVYAVSGSAGQDVRIQGA
jgi:hypothetical protein